MTRLLVTYASKRGSTEEIAQAVAETLHDAGIEVDCRDAATVDRIDDYDAVVLGGAETRRLSSDPRRLLRRHRDALAARPLWTFHAGADDAAGDGGAVGQTVALDRPVAFRDRSDWDAISAWARQIAAQLPR
ncbi:MAG TPA: flavodoxin domain-containing protein [Conexibacter sp.]|nr:flavodoxin domain-containing protein [Conexibacter sp.]